MPHLLVISIGPVQGFIAAARKARDLWFGSHMLSEMSRAVARSLVDDFGAEMVFPSPQALESDTAVANKILAIVDRYAPVEVAQHTREVAQACLARYGEMLREGFQKQLGPDFQQFVDEELIARQIEHFLEFASAWVTYDPGRPEQYPEARDQVEWLLAARKGVRDFAAADGPEGLPKSSLDPGRDSVLKPAAYRQTTGARPPVAKLHVRRGEYLDGISLIKRLAGYKRFVSVPRVAVDPFIRRAQREPELVQLRRLASQLEERESDAATWFDAAPGSGLEQYTAFPYETQLFYDQTDDELHESDQILAEKFRVIVRALAARLHVNEMPAYFAVLAADGDGVGELISSLDSPPRHRALSDAMVGFASQAQVITGAHQGALVYGGGDDVLAFLPLDRALDCADALRRAFERIIQPAAGDHPVSLSVGVSIGHHSEHLQNLLNWARAAEQAAKQYTGARPKNALAVALHTRAGGHSDLSVVLSWDDDPLRTVWSRWIDRHRREAIPDGAAYELAALERAFRGVDGGGAMLAREAARLLGDTSLMVESTGQVRSIAAELLIARRIGSAIDIAEGRPSRAN